MVFMFCMDVLESSRLIRIVENDTLEDQVGVSWPWLGYGVAGLSDSFALSPEKGCN